MGKKLPPLSVRAEKKETTTSYLREKYGAEAIEAGKRLQPKNFERRRTTSIRVQTTAPTRNAMTETYKTCESMCNDLPLRC